MVTFWKTVTGFQPFDTVSIFEAAAEERYWDGVACFFEGRHHGAIYLWGYTCEMLLKATLYTRGGYSPAQPIPSGKVMLMTSVEMSLHHRLNDYLDSYQSLTAQHGAGTVVPFKDLQIRVQTVWESWRETLRYKTSQAGSNESKPVEEAVTWMLDNYGRY